VRETGITSATAISSATVISRSSMASKSDFGGRPVDFVSQDDIAEDRSLLELKDVLFAFLM
jgi:hypothetical protein